MVNWLKTSMVFPFFFVWALPSHGLWLGDLTVNSYLGQPLQGQLILEEVGDITQAEILVRVADKSEYERLEIVRQEFLDDIKFEFLLSNEVTDSLIVTTRLPIAVDAFDLIVQVHWDEKVAWNRYRVEIKPDPQALNQLLPGLRYRISDNETLWSISKKISSDEVSIYAVMKGIQRLNPSAFLDGDVNGLMAGSVILLPTEDDLFSDSEGVEINEARNEPPLDESPFSKTSEKPDPTVTQVHSSAALAEIETSSREIAKGESSNDELLDQIYILYERIRELEEDLQTSNERSIEMELELETLLQEMSRSLVINPEILINYFYDFPEVAEVFFSDPLSFVQDSKNHLHLSVAMVMIFFVGLLLIFSIKKIRSRRQEINIEFDHSEQNLNNLKDLKEPEKGFREVMDEVGLVEKQGEELNHASLLDGDEAENALHAEEADPISSKLDLARAYIDMGDQALANPLLDEILEEGSDEQVDEARELIVRLREL